MVRLDSFQHSLVCNFAYNPCFLQSQVLFFNNFRLLLLHLHVSCARSIHVIQLITQNCSTISAMILSPWPIFYRYLSNYVFHSWLVLLSICPSKTATALTLPTTANSSPIPLSPRTTVRRRRFTSPDASLEASDSEGTGGTFRCDWRGDRRGDCGDWPSTVDAALVSPGGRWNGGKNSSYWKWFLV